MKIQFLLALFLLCIFQAEAISYSLADYKFAESNEKHKNFGIYLEKMELLSMNKSQPSKTLVKSVEKRRKGFTYPGIAVTGFIGLALTGIGAGLVASSELCISNCSGSDNVNANIGAAMIVIGAGMTLGSLIAILVKSGKSNYRRVSIKSPKEYSFIPNLLPVSEQISVVYQF